MKNRENKKLILPGRNSGGVYGNQYQVGLALNRLAVLKQLFNVAVCLDNGLWYGQGFILAVLWPISCLLVLLAQLDAHALRDSVGVWSLSCLAMGHEQSE